MFAIRNKLTIKINNMELKIKTELLECGSWMASCEGGAIGTPGMVKYGETKYEAAKKIKEALEKKGHKVLNYQTNIL